MVSILFEKGCSLETYTKKGELFNCHLYYTYFLSKDGYTQNSCSDDQNIHLEYTEPNQNNISIYSQNIVLSWSSYISPKLSKEFFLEHIRVISLFRKWLSNPGMHPNLHYFPKSFEDVV